MEQLQDKPGPDQTPDKDDKHTSTLVTVSRDTETSTDYKTESEFGRTEIMDTSNKNEEESGEELTAAVDKPTKMDNDAAGPEATEVKADVNDEQKNDKQVLDLSSEAEKQVQSPPCLPKESETNETNEEGVKNSSISTNNQPVNQQAKLEDNESGKENTSQIGLPGDDGDVAELGKEAGQQDDNEKVL